jgi:uncharacterized protein (DUF2147 family)
MPRTLIASAAILAASISGAAAGRAGGVWLRDNGASRIRIAPCGGEALCGAIVWLKDPGGPARVGQQVFFDMKPHGENVWTGSAFNPEDGKTHSGKMTLSGDRLTTAGCVLGGLICKSVSWTRAR